MLPFEINKQGRIQKQLATNIIKMINEGNIKFGEYLPSIRVMSEHFSVSRNSIIAAYEQLANLGMIESRERSGFIVSVMVDNKLDNKVIDKFSSEYYNINIDDRGLSRVVDAKIPYSFIKTWATNLYGKSESICEPIFCKNIIDSINSLRGVNLHLHNTLITSNVQTAISLLGLRGLNTDAVPSVLMESPYNPIVYNIFKKLGYLITLIPIDEDGLCVDLLPEKTFNYIYTTPSHQFPTGSILSQERRKNLIDWCNRTGTYLIEDDSHSLLSLGNSVTSPIYFNYHSDYLIYISGLSQVLGSSTNTGIITLPDKLYSVILDLKKSIYDSNETIQSSLINGYLNSGKLIRDISGLVQSRREKYYLAYSGVDSANIGCQLWGELRSTYFSFEVKNKDSAWLRRLPNEFIQISQICTDEALTQYHDRVIYPFAQLSIERIEKVNNKLLELSYF